MTRNGRGHSTSSISDAIEKLEAAGEGKSAEVKEFLDRELKDIKEKLKDLKPYFDELKEKAEHEVKHAKYEVEEKVKDNPWAALGIVGLIAFFIGWLIGGSRRH